MLEAYGLTDPGCVRGNNEDYFLIDPETGLYLVADGMGGQQAGEHASRTAAQAVADVVREAASRNPEVLQAAFLEADRRVKELARSNPAFQGMGTTLVAVLDCGGEQAVASVGDSRCYLWTEGILGPITVDQSWRQEVGSTIGLTERELREHPFRNVLTAAIGANQPLRTFSCTISLRPGQELLLATDGLHGVIGEETIADVLIRERTLEAKCHSLIEAACAAGAPDNVTVVLVRPAG